MRTTKEMRGARVLGGKRGRRKIGKIAQAVFHPTEPRLVGYIVKRPDLFWMIKRNDRFLAYDAFRIVDGRVIGTVDSDSWDAPACKRLKIDWDRCLLLENMPLKTSDGHEIGKVGSITYDERTGKIISFAATDGLTSDVILGAYTIPADHILKYADGFLLVKPEAQFVQAEGGLAEKAGESVAVAAQGIGDATAKASKKAGKAINKGAYSLGTALGKAKRALSEEEEIASASNEAAKTTKTVTKSTSQKNSGGDSVASAESEKATAKPPISETAAKAVGKQLKKSKGMFAAFKEEYKKGSHGDE